MANFRQGFLEYVIAHKILLFGEFSLKSGRKSPYFFNSGLFNSGAKLATLGHYYAQAIADAKIEFDVLFGPAYKGIPLVTAASIALWEQFQRDAPYAFNRKEAKTHGEGGHLVGAPLSGKVLIIDDVISAGLTIGESVELVRNSGAQPIAVVISCDRQERGATSALSAVQEVSSKYQIKVISIINLQQIITYLSSHSQYAAILASLQQYQQEYGVT